MQIVRREAHLANARRSIRESIESHSNTVCKWAQHFNRRRNANGCQGAFHLDEFIFGLRPSSKALMPWRKNLPETQIKFRGNAWDSDGGKEQQTWFSLLV
jgi:hypothetical protein